MALVLPPAGTTSRERAFCGSWLALSTPAKADVLERDESQKEAERACLEGLRAGVRRTLDRECSNWTKLMDFEVRAIVDRVTAPCIGPRD